MKNKIVAKLCKYHLLGILAVSLFLGLLKLCLPGPYGVMVENLESNGFTHLEVLGIQLSVSFIVISVVTVFSQKTTVIYWEDIMQYKLVRPHGTNFNAIASYIFADQLVSLVLVMIASPYVYATFFISVLLIMWLSLKMLIAVFSSDLIKEELAERYRREKEARLTDKAVRNDYREHKRKLIQYTLQAMDGNDIDTVCENMELLYRNGETADAAYLVDKMEKGGKIYMVSRVAKTCSFIFAEPENMEFFSRLCRKMISGESSEDAITYIVSVFKSMYEYHSECPDALPEEYEKVLGGFVSACREDGGEAARTGELLLEISRDGFLSDYGAPKAR